MHTKYKLLTIVRLLFDVQSLNDRIGSVSGAGDIGDYLLKLVNEKTVLGTRPTPVPAPAPASPDAQNSESTVSNGAEAVKSFQGERTELGTNLGSAEKDDPAPAEKVAEPEKSLEKS